MATEEADAQAARPDGDGAAASPPQPGHDAHADSSPDATLLAGSGQVPVGGGVGVGVGGVAVLSGLESSVVSGGVSRSAVVQLAVFAVFSLSNSAMWITFAPVSDLVALRYGVSLADVDQLSTVYMWLYLPAVLLASTIDSRMGLKWVMRWGTVLNVVGAGFRALGAQRGWSSFMMVLFGQALCAVAQGCVLSVPARLSAAWFPVEHRATATGLAAFANQVGVALGFVIPPAFVGEARAGLGPLMDLQAVVCLVAAVLVWMYAADEPNGGPSRDTSEPVQLFVKRFMREMGTLLRNRPVRLVACSMGTGVGVTYCIATTINPMMADLFPGQDEEIGWGGAIAAIAGLPVMVLAGVLLDRSDRLVRALMICAGTAVAYTLALTLAIQLRAGLWVIFLGLAAMGMSSSAAIVLGLHAVAEVGPRSHSETASGGLFMFAAQVVGIVLIALVDWLRGSLHTLGTNLLLTAAQVVALVLLCFLRVDKPPQHDRMIELL